VTEDIGMIPAAIHDMAKTRVTEGEIIALHEGGYQMQHGRDVLATRVELLEGHLHQEQSVDGLGGAAIRRGAGADHGFA
jgi:acetoin utilization deacetylase AcuC-like enzyme